MNDTDKNVKVSNDLFLKKIHMGKIQGQLNGNIYFDKPWTTRFADRSDADFDISETLYKTYIKFANKYLNETAVCIAETEERYTHKSLIQMIDKASNGLFKFGIRKNIKVGIFLNGSIEEVISLLALNKLGAISKYIDYTKSISAIKHSLEETKIDSLIMDECFLSLEQIVNIEKLPVIVANTSNMYTGQMISFSEILNMGEGEKIDAENYIEGKPSVMINSSGTTGEPKPIVHTDFSINAAAQKMLYTDYPLTQGNVLIKMVPSQIGLGLVTSLYTGLLSGVEVVLLNGKNVQEITKNMISFVAGFEMYRGNNNLPENAKLNIFTSPIFIRALINSSNIKNLSFMGSMLAAGSKMEKGELDELNKKATAKGCKIPICNGYGQNELAGAATLNYVHYNVNGSAGFPTIGTDIVVVDQETFNILEPYKVGVILESSNSQFLCYENLEEKTQAAFVKLADGSQWFNSFDLGYMDEEGFLFITGRINRVVIRSDFKISLESIEEKMKKLPFIFDCAAVVRKHGGSVEDIIAFIKSDIVEEKLIQKMVVESSILSDFEMPSKIIVLNDIPYKSNGKVDYPVLEKIASNIKEV